MIRRALARVRYYGRRQSQNRRHCSDAHRHCFLHVRSALAHQLHCIGKIQRTCRYQRRILSQAVPSNKIREQSQFRRHPKHRHRAGQNRRLRVRGLLQFLFRAFEAHFRNGESQRLVRFFKHGSRHGVFLRQFSAHSRVLRSLSRKNKRYFSHTFILSLPHFSHSLHFMTSFHNGRGSVVSNQAHKRMSFHCNLSFRAKRGISFFFYARSVTSDSSCSIFSFMFALASPAATRIAFLIAFAFERPCPITQTPRTPSSGAPPYSVQSIVFFST